MDGLDQYIMYSKSTYSPRRYVYGVKEGNYTPWFTEDPTQAQILDLATCRKVDESTALFMETQPWTPGLQAEIENSHQSSRVIHYAPDRKATEESTRTICGNVIHKDSTSADFADVTCEKCIRHAHRKKTAPRDIPRGYWPIKGKYYGQDIRTLPASYWCWVVDKTDMVKPGSYLHEFFLQNEAIFRRRAGKKMTRKSNIKQT